MRGAPCTRGIVKITLFFICLFLSLSAFRRLVSLLQTKHVRRAAPPLVYLDVLQLRKQISGTEYRAPSTPGEDGGKDHKGVGG